MLHFSFNFNHNLTLFPLILVLELCLNCKNHSKKAITVDKNLGTQDDIDATELFKHQKRTNYTDTDSDVDHQQFERSDNAFMPIHSVEQTTPSNRIDILQQKRIADSLDKMCPMCGKIYSSSASFEIFQDHVESHFIDDTDLDLSVEKNYEFISNTVGNF